MVIFPAIFHRINKLNWFCGYFATWKEKQARALYVIRNINDQLVVESTESSIDANIKTSADFKSDEYTVISNITCQIIVK